MVTVGDMKVAGGKFKAEFHGKPKMLVADKVEEVRGGLRPMTGELYEAKHILRQLRYGVIVAGKKHYRIVIARLDMEDNPLVFVREWDKDPEYGYDRWYSLYNKALTAEEADEILKKLKEGDMRKARNLLKKQFSPEGVIVEDVKEIRLDDALPDEWYEAWKNMEVPITSVKDFPGYYEEEVDPDRGL